MANDELTPVEEQIAARAAAGRRNREIATELRMREPVVDAHLTQIYRKLGVRSRTELATRLTQIRPT
jgi:DNA-binding CsgD family transcriptional regulator